MAARVIPHSARSGLNSINSGYESPRYRARSQTRPPLLTSGGAHIHTPSRTPRSVSAHRGPNNNTPLTLAAVLNSVSTSSGVPGRKRTTPGGTKIGAAVTPVRPTRGPIVTPNRKVSAPTRLVNSSTARCDSSAATSESQPGPSNVTQRRRPTPHSNAYASGPITPVSAPRTRTASSSATARRQATTGDTSDGLSASSSSSFSSNNSSTSSVNNSRSGAGAAGGGDAYQPTRRTALAVTVPICKDRKITVPLIKNTGCSSSNKYGGSTGSVVSRNTINRCFSQPTNFYVRPTGEQQQDFIKESQHINNNNNDGVIDEQYSGSSKKALTGLLDDTVTPPSYVHHHSSSPSLSPIALERTERFEAGFLDELPGSPASEHSSTPSSAEHLPLRRISKDHGGAKGVPLVPDPEARRGPPSSAPSSVLPSKRGHRDIESSSDNNSCATTKENKQQQPSNKLIKVKKMSGGTKLLKDEAMEVEAGEGCPSSTAAASSYAPQSVLVNKTEGTPSLQHKNMDEAYQTSCSGVSATITINSVIPERSTTITTAPLVVDSTTQKGGPEYAPPQCNTTTSSTSKDTLDGGGKKQTYNVAKSAALTADQSASNVKSVSITRLEAADSSPAASPSSSSEVVCVTTPSVVTRVVSAQRKLSPTPKDGGGAALTRKMSGSSSNAVGNKKMKKSKDNEDDGCGTVEGDEESNLKRMQEKMVNLERMVSDLVKNAEIKKQEIAAHKMEIKRLKEAARERGHTSDEDYSRTSTGPPTSPVSTTPATSKPLATITTVATSTPTISTAPHRTPATDNKTYNDRIEELLEENRALRSQLLHLGGTLDSSRLSDQEKEALLKGGSWGERSTTGATIGDWDNKSSSSEVSVACLQDRIMQMEETHYCTNEELQATLQELDDLREQLAESQAEIQQMQEEKQVLLESLTQQTERLSDTRAQNLTLKQLVIQHSENSHTVSNCVNTQRLMELLKSVEDDRERLVLMQEDLQAQKAAAAVAERRSLQDSQMYRDRMKSLESLVECSSAGKAAAEAQTAELQETVKALKLENTRLETTLQTAKEKVAELEAKLVGGGSVGEVLEVVRAEKEQLEQQVEDLSKQHHTTICEADKLREQITSLQEKLKVAEASARDGLHDASARSERMEEERRALQQQVTTTETALADAKLTAQRHLQHKRELKTALSDAQKRLSEAIENKQTTEELMRQQKEKFDKQVEEWHQFQCDLLTTVRVANEFKMDAQSQLEKMQQENSMLKHKITMLEKKINGSKAVSNPVSTISTSTDRRSAIRPLSRGDSRVKSLIESLESGVPVTVAATTANGRPGNRSSSTSAIESSNVVVPPAPRKTSQPLTKRPDPEGLMRSTSSPSPLKDTGNIDSSVTTASTSNNSSTGVGTGGGNSGSNNNAGPVSPLRTIHRNSYSEGLNNITSSSTTTSAPPQSNLQSSTCFSKVPAPPSSPTANLPDTVKMSQLNSDKNTSKLIQESAPLSILSNKVEVKRPTYTQLSGDKKDPLAVLAQGGGSKRNALLKWCQSQTLGYPQVDITNFSSSWNDGLALCAILDTYIPEKINYRTLNHSDKRANFEKALAAAESVGIPSTLDISDMLNSERPNWKTVYNYVTSIFAHFET